MNKQLHQVWQITNTGPEQGPRFARLEDALHHARSQSAGALLAVRQKDGRWYQFAPGVCTLCVGSAPKPNAEPSRLARSPRSRSRPRSTRAVEAIEAYPSNTQTELRGYPDLGPYCIS